MLPLFTNYIVTFLGKYRLVCTFMLCLVMVLLSMELYVVDLSIQRMKNICSSVLKQLPDVQIENMLPGILKRMQCKREAATDNPIKDLHQRNSRISVHADGLPKYTCSISTKEWVKKKSYAWQAHLQQIAHYLVPGKGVWWHFT